ncbi:RNA polymerase sigma factor [Spirosoma endbachense]|uniref:Sigma-70 family RNA polymerase sigma factor n=1 Tax=Spirosoma endbachense TaxID=2666025 RepID=A0A6P1W678_9BACT|nr:RNA polymerase sigma factor [Spirosoma endbachense]QHW00516.1 sigma-70 family RNA polymerase sigma factor [Spirosoma endbachense]
MTDLELLRACQRNDPRAQTVLYQRFKGRLMGLHRRYARNRPEAEDMFQEGFIRIFQQLHTIEQPERMLHWMKRVMVNTAINAYHKNQQQRYETDRLDDIGEAALECSTHDYRDTFARLSADEVAKLVHELPDGYRMVFKLHVMDGYNHPEIAQLLDISEGTSKSQLVRAKNSLKVKLKKIGIVRYECC